MSGKAGSIGSIAVGVVLIVAGFFSYGATWAVIPSLLGGALTIAGGVIGLTFQPKSASAETARSQDLQFANAGEGFPVPVIFGEQKIIPNFMNWQADTFRVVEGSVAVGGKGGGGTTQPNGVLDYYLSFELALCMGPIDEIGQVISAPGDIFCRGANYSTGNGVTATQSGVTVTFSTPINISAEFVGGTIVWADGTTNIITSLIINPSVNAYPLGIRVDTSQTKTAQRFQLFGKIEQIVFDGSSDYEELTLGGVNEGGFVRVYRGTETQNRVSANDPYYDTGMNYRNVAWAIFYDFWIGRGSPTPKTYQFIVRRFPRCIRDNDTTVDEIEVRGSVDPNHPSYYQANPAAVIYEIMTNRLWGRKISSDEIDEDSFASVSRFFKDKNIGISFTLDGQEKLSSILDALRLQLKIILTWKAGTWKLRCLMDNQDTSATIQTFNSDTVDELRVVRPLWPSTTNDIRAEFNSRSKLYKPDSVHVQDQANIELTGRVSASTTTLRVFTDWNLAFRQAVRTLVDASNPSAMAMFNINRFKSNVEVGDCIRIVWKEWGENTVTSYFIVSKLEPMQQGDDRIKVYATEDVALSPIAGEETEVSLTPVSAWEKVIDFTDSDIGKATPKSSQNGAIFPILAVEMPAMFDPENRSWMSIFGVKPSGGTIGSQVFTSPENSNTYTQMVGAVDYAISITLSTAILHTRNTDRSASFFEFVAAPADASRLLAVSTVSADSDDLETADSLDLNYLVIGDEIMKLGKIEHVSGNTYRARNALRGCFGSPVRVHASGTIAFFRETITKSINARQLYAVSNYVAKLKAYPVTQAGVNQVGDPFYVYREGENNQKIMWLRDRPYPSEFLRAIRAGNSIYITARYRASDSGAGSRSFFGQYDPVTNTVNGVIRDFRDDVFSLSGSVNPFYPEITNAFLGVTYNADKTATFLYAIDLSAPTPTLSVFTRSSVRPENSVYRSTIDVQ